MPTSREGLSVPCRSKMTSAWQILSRSSFDLFLKRLFLDFNWACDKRKPFFQNSVLQSLIWRHERYFQRPANAAFKEKFLLVAIFFYFPFPPSVAEIFLFINTMKHNTFFGYLGIKRFRSIFHKYHYLCNPQLSSCMLMIFYVNFPLF